MPGRAKVEKQTLQARFLGFGKLILLAGTLIAAFLFSAILGMKLAVRGTVVQVPSLFEMAQEEARSLLEESNLKMKVIGKRYDDTVPEGAVISQLPGHGSSIKAGGEVQVAVSLGRRSLPVPDLIHTNVRLARLMAEQNGFELGNISEIDLGLSEEEKIIAQVPPPGTAKNVGRLIDVLVQQGKTFRYIMPDLRGENLNRVLQFFKENQLEVGRIQYRDHPSYPRGSVIRQYPEPGYQLTQRDTINLEVAR